MNSKIKVEENSKIQILTTHSGCKEKNQGREALSPRDGEQERKVKYGEAMDEGRERDGETRGSDSSRKGGKGREGKIGKGEYSYKASRKRWNAHSWPVIGKRKKKKTGLELLVGEGTVHTADAGTRERLWQEEGERREVMGGGRGAC